MNVIISNEQQGQIASLDIDIIKSITGAYGANEIVEMFKNFFYSKMVLDVTAVRNYTDLSSFKTLADGLDVEKTIFFIPEGSSLCTPQFLAQLITYGIYNFTTNIEGVKYLLKRPNTYSDVAHIQQMGGVMNAPQPVPEEPSETKLDSEQHYQPAQEQPTQQQMVNRTIRLGLVNVTEHAGATSLAYMFKKELASIYGENKVIAIEVNKNDFQFYNDRSMISTNTNQLKEEIYKREGLSVVIIDLNDYEDRSICDEVLYLVEPSTLRLNKLIRKDKNTFTKIKGKKIILNQSLLTNKDISELEYEAGIKVFYNMPPVNDRKSNDVINELLAKLGLIQTGKNDSGKIFGLFRR